MIKGELTLYGLSAFDTCDCDDTPSQLLGAYGGNCNEAGALNNQGSNGNYWSSTGQSTTNAYRANFNTSGNVNTGVDGNNKYNGRAVRCIENLFN